LRLKKNATGAFGTSPYALHFEGTYSFGDVVGFAEHTASVVKYSFETKILHQKEIPPLVTIPR